MPSNPIKDYYFIHRDTPNTEAVIVEYGFLDSPKDDVNQLKNNYKNYAEAVVKAIAEYKNIPYVAPAGGNYYTVVKGDSLWSIANKFGLTVDDLKKLNNLSTNILKVGDTLKVKEQVEELPEDYLVYVVKSGDSLWSIANTYNTTVDTLIKINNLTSSSLSINQQLYIPKEKDIEIEVEPSSATEYTVKSGDSLWSIAKSYGVSVDAIKSKNNLKSNTLSIGQKLIIPVQEIIVEEKEKNLPEGIEYIVSKGDNLYSIANKYNVSVNEIKNANNLTSNLLNIGQVLTIPGTKDYAEYVVKSGDSLWAIANNYGTTVSDLMKVNNLESTKLSIGQKLLIPSK